MSKPQPKNKVGLLAFDASGEMRFCTIDRIEGGEVWIRESSHEEPMRARLTGSALSQLAGSPLEQRRGEEVVVWFQGRWPVPAPTIVDFVFDQLPEAMNRHDAAFPSSDVDDILVDGKKITIEADESIELRCGSSRLVFTADGKILLRGKHVTCQASDHNLIRGAVVKIN